MEILVATQNLGKLQEFTDILTPLAIKVLTPTEVGVAALDVAETGSTFTENALLKAKAFAQASDRVTLADDSGLGVTALAGRPGIYSKRVGQNDSERLNWVLEQLVDQPDRTAWFSSVLCLYDPQANQAQFFEGRVTGTIAHQQAGEVGSGFGYDPIFIPDGYHQTFSELGPAIKNTISHRARALAALEAYLSQQAPLA